MKIDIDTKDIIEAMADSIDSEDLLRTISDDIFKSNHDWWTARVVKPIKDDILRLTQTKKFCANMAQCLIDMTDIEEEIIKQVSEKIVEDIENKLPKPKVVWGKNESKQSIRSMKNER